MQANMTGKLEEEGNWSAGVHHKETICWANVPPHVALVPPTHTFDAVEYKNTPLSCAVTITSVCVGPTATP